MGYPADAETRKARQRALLALNRLWQGIGAPMTQAQVRAWLKKQAIKGTLALQQGGVTEAEVHIAKFDQEQCETLIKLIRKSFVVVLTDWERLLDDDSF